MTEYRYVYYLSDRCLHNILEICFKNYKFDILDQYEKETNFKIDESWLNDLALHTQVVIKKSKQKI